MSLRFPASQSWGVLVVAPLGRSARTPASTPQADIAAAGEGRIALDQVFRLVTARRVLGPRRHDLLVNPHLPGPRGDLLEQPENPGDLAVHPDD